jgi:hypothetical protein
MPKTTNTYNTTVQLEDNVDNITTKSYTITILPKLNKWKFFTADHIVDHAGYVKYTPSTGIIGMMQYSPNFLDIYNLEINPDWTKYTSIFSVGPHNNLSTNDPKWGVPKVNIQNISNLEFELINHQPGDPLRIFNIVTPTRSNNWCLSYDMNHISYHNPHQARWRTIIYITT